MNLEQRILVTGAAGYIGSHVVKALYEKGFRHIWGADFAFGESPNTEFVSTMLEGKFEGDLTGDIADLEFGTSFLERGPRFDHIIHLAAYISVEESVKKPSKYWFNNLVSTGNIIRMANSHGANLVFASTGTAFDPNNPYAESKVECESMINDLLAGNRTIFRFYNVSGCAPGLKPTGEATHLIRVAANAVHSGKTMKIFGDDWETVDGTCVRDYIDVRDIAESIVSVVTTGFASQRPFECLGSGEGFTVLDVLGTMQSLAESMDKSLKYEIVDRRAGDVGSMICPRELMYPHLKINYSLADMCSAAYQATGE